MPVQFDALLELARYRSAALQAEAERDHIAHLLSQSSPRRDYLAPTRQLTQRLLAHLTRQRLSASTPEPNFPPA